MPDNEVVVEVRIPIPPLYWNLRNNKRKYKQFIEAYLRKYNPDCKPKHIKGGYVICDKTITKRR